ncbi:MAG: ABC transporter substrate-binding protein [Thermodesulfovibrionales bacterium]
MKRRTFPLISCILAALSLFSCSSSNRLDGYLYLRQNANPSTLDPALIVDVSGAVIAAKLFNGLVRFRDDLGVAPDIAERWEISGGGRTYRFHLRKGVLFSNGREVTARDFKYSFERLLNPRTKSPNTWVLDKAEGAREFMQGGAGEVRGFRAIDAYTFEVRLAEPFSPFLSMLAMTAAYVVPGEEVKRRGEDFSAFPVGTGPFVLKEWLPGREVELAGNSRYFEGRAKVKGIMYRIIPEDLTAVTEFETGNLDILSLPSSAYAKFRDDPKWGRLVVSMEGLNTYYLGLNAAKPPFSNAALRRAVSHALDRKRILETFLEGRGRLAAGPVPDLLRKWKGVNARDAFSYDPSLARRIVREEGFAGLQATMYVTADQDVVDLAEIIQAFLAEAGIVVKIKQLEWSAYKQAVNRGEADLFWLSWWADYPDAENFLFPLFHSSNLGPAGNRTRYVNREVDALIEKGQHAQGEEERRAYYRRAEEIIIGDVPWVPFWHRSDLLVKQPWVEGYTVHPIYSMDKGMETAITR